MSVPCRASSAFGGTTARSLATVALASAPTGSGTVARKASTAAGPVSVSGMARPGDWLVGLEDIGPPVDHADVGLVGGIEDEFLDVDVGRAAAAPQDGLRHVLGDQRTRVGVDLLGARLVAAVAHETELGLHEAGLDVGDADAGAVHIHAQPFREDADGGLAGAVDAAARVGPAAGDGAEVDDVAAALRQHLGDDLARDGEEAE